MKKYILASLICIPISTILLSAPLEERITQAETRFPTFSKPRSPEISVAQKEEAELAISTEPKLGVTPPAEHGSIHSITYKTKTDLINTINKQLGAASLTNPEIAALAKNLPVSTADNWSNFDIELDKILTKRDLIINHLQFINDLHEAESKTGGLATLNRIMDSINLTIAKLFNKKTLDASTHPKRKGYTIHSTPNGKPAAQARTPQQVLAQEPEDGGYYASSYDTITGSELLDPRIATGFSQPAPEATSLIPEKQDAQAAQDRSAQEMVANLRKLGIIDTPTETPVAPARRSITATAQPKPTTPITITKGNKGYIDAIVQPIKTISDLSRFTQRIKAIPDRTIALQAIGSKVFNLTGKTSLEEIQARIRELDKAIKQPEDPRNQALINTVLKNMSVAGAPVSINGTASTNLSENNIITRTAEALGSSKPKPTGENGIRAKLAEFIGGIYDKVDSIAFVENSPSRKSILAKQAAAQDAAARQAVLGGLRTQAPSRAKAPVTPPTQRPTIDTGSPIPSHISDSSGAFPISSRAEDQTLRATSIDGSDNTGYPSLRQPRTSFEGTLEPAFKPDDPAYEASYQEYSKKVDAATARKPAPQPLTRLQSAQQAFGNAARKVREAISPSKPAENPQPLSPAELRAQLRKQSQPTVRSGRPKDAQAAPAAQAPALDAQSLVSDLQDLGFAPETPVQRGQRVFGGKKQTPSQPATAPIVDGQYAGIL